PNVPQPQTQRPHPDPANHPMNPTLLLLARMFHGLRALPGSRGSVAQVSNLPYRRLPVGRL
ncbi:MAG TPA: hypothetical protein VN829_23230, partial [Dongiaceae bacterium]|nr:hypothetical protein [Dongiaceae bacterium]